MMQKLELKRFPSVRPVPTETSPRAASGPAGVLNATAAAQLDRPAPLTDVLRLMRYAAAANLKASRTAAADAVYDAFIECMHRALHRLHEMERAPLCPKAGYTQRSLDDVSRSREGCASPALSTVGGSPGRVGSPGARGRQSRTAARTPWSP